MLLQTNQLTKHYGSFPALVDLTLNVDSGEVFGLLGPNGSGKSTALRLLLGFLRPTAGTAAIAGHDCWEDTVRARRHVAYLPGELRLYENMTSRQLVEFLEGLRGGFREGSEDALARRLEIDLDRPIAHLSSGMKRKVALLQVLVANADLLILDEPTNTLDPTMRDELLEQLKHARAEGKAVLFSSHVLAEAERICDRVGILKHGRLVHVQPMSELRAANVIEVHFETAPSHAPDLPGLRMNEQHNSHWSFEYDGPLSSVLQWLASQRVKQLRIEPLGLGAIYRRFHGADL
jgi:ABC-2 type transport system ATP-binding protein